MSLNRIAIELYKCSTKHILINIKYQFFYIFTQTGNGRKTVGFSYNRKCHHKCIMKKKKNVSLKYHGED